jgi:membrane protease YdiL (CAAX protease family)
MRRLIVVSAFVVGLYCLPRLIFEFLKESQKFFALNLLRRIAAWGADEGVSFSLEIGLREASLSRIVFHLIAVGLAWYSYPAIARSIALAKAPLGIIVSIVAGLTSFLLTTVFVRMIMGKNVPSFPDVDLYDMSSGEFLYAIYTSLTGPFAEEFIFRGIAFELMKNASGWQRYLVCVFPWALSHIGSAGLIHVVASLIAGTFCFFVRSFFGSFHYSFIAHGTHNLLVVFD